MRHKLPEPMKSAMLDDVAFLPLDESTARQIETMRKTHGQNVFLHNVWPVFSKGARRSIIAASGI